MQDFLKLINGKKTYISGIALILAILGTKYGIIPADSFWYVVTGLGALIAIFMRAGIAKLAPGSDVDIPMPDAPQMTQDIPDLKTALAEVLKDVLAEQKESKPNGEA